MNNGHCIATVCASSEFAKRIAKEEDMSLEIFHSIVKQMGLRLSCVYGLYYFGELEKEDLIDDFEDGIISTVGVRKLLAEDSALLKGFESSLIASGVDALSVDFEKQNLYGIIENAELIAIAIAVKWRQSNEIVDVQPVVLPSFDSIENSTRLMQFVAFDLFKQGYEFQYRVIGDDINSKALAESIPLELFGQWQSVLV